MRLIKSYRHQVITAIAVSLMCGAGALAARQTPASRQGIALTPLQQSVYHNGWIDLNKNGKEDVYENPQASVKKRVEDLLSRMNMKEKTMQLVTLYGYGRVLKDAMPTPQWKHSLWKDGIANIDEEFNGVASGEGLTQKYVWPPKRHARAINEIQKWFVENTRLGIPVDMTNEGVHGVAYSNATNFPDPIGLGATWDRNLLYKVGHITGAEAKAAGYTNVYAPILGLARDPRWGRVVETFSEDPYLVAALGTEQSKGIQDTGVGSTMKHFVVYSVPKGGRDGDDRTDPHVTQRQLRELFFYPFEHVIHVVNPLGVMSSYNDYNGVPISASHHFLYDVLRKQMGFTGYVVSDSAAVKFIHSKHHVAPTHKDAVRQWIEAGGDVRTDFTPPATFVKPLRELIKEHKLSMSVIDKRVREVLSVKFRLGLFDHPYVKNPSESPNAIGNQQHRDTALKASLESMVLLKNKQHTLPLSNKLKSILVVGPNAKATAYINGRYGPGKGPAVSVYDGIKKAAPKSTKIIYAKGSNLLPSTWPKSELYPAKPSKQDQQMIQNAVDKAHGVDAIIAVVGGNRHTVGESRSRTSLNLPGAQRNLLKALAKTGQPVVAVLINGRPLTINWTNAHIPAILEAWFAGEAAGTAVAQTLFGDYNPGGKLPITFPKTVGQIPYNFPHIPGSQTPQHGSHTRANGALFPFGYGLSYTTFKYDHLKVSPSSIKPKQSVSISFRLTNIGKRAGDEVPQLYLKERYADVIPFDKVLRGFKRVHLKAGQSKVVHFSLDAQDMQILNRQMKWQVEPGQFEVQIGNSSTDVRLKKTFNVKS